MDPAFLLLSLFLPRLALFVFWLNDGLPHLPMPNFVELIMAVAVPRIIILFMIYRTMGMTTWFWIHLVVALFVYMGSGYKASRD